jgi:hypothetical protein
MRISRPKAVCCWLASVGVTIVLSHVLVGCAPSLQRQGYVVTPSQQARDCEVVITKQEDFHSENFKVLGTMRVADAGLSTNCSEHDVLAILRTEACKLGAQAIVLRDIKRPGLTSSCYRVTADFVSLVDTTQILSSELVKRDAYAAAPGTPASAPPGSPGNNENMVWRVQVLYHGFISEQMRDAYGSAYGLQGTMIQWPETSSRVGLRSDLALYGAGNGAAEVRDDSWTVTKRKLGMGVFDVSFTVLYLLLEPNTPHKVMPYAGVGLGGVFGFDQLWFGMNREGEYYEGHSALAFRPAFEAHALLGAAIPLTPNFSLVGEMQWIQAGNAGLKEFGRLSKEDKVVRDLVHSVLRYPDMNITGWRALVGAQFSWGDTAWQSDPR